MRNNWTSLTIYTTRIPGSSSRRTQPNGVPPSIPGDAGQPAGRRLLGKCVCGGPENGPMGQAGLFGWWVAHQLIKMEPNLPKKEKLTPNLPIDRFDTYHRSKWRRAAMASPSGSPPRYAPLFTTSTYHHQTHPSHPISPLNHKPITSLSTQQPGGQPLVYLPGDMVQGKLRARVTSRTTARAVRMKVRVVVLACGWIGVRAVEWGLN